MRIVPAQNYYKTNFRSNMTFDIGGSQREGSCKIYYATSKDDEQIYTAKTTVNALGKTKFKDSKDFIGQIIKKIKTVQENNLANVKDMGYPEDENILKSLTIFLPSYTNQSFAYYLPNNKNSMDRPLKDIDCSMIKEMLKEKGVKIDPDMRFTLLQDATGTGLAIAKKLYNLGMLEKGNFYTACITGGGCGTANIRMNSDDKVFIETSGSALLVPPNSLDKVSKAGASAPAVITNFCRPFGINEELIDDIKSCHKAEFTLSDPCTFEKDIKTENLKKLLLSTDKYDLTNETENEFTLKVKPEYERLYDICREHTIEQYCDAFARLSALKRTDGSNGLIITGPLARAVNRASVENYGKTISERVEKRILSLYNTYEISKAQELYQFKVICDDRFFIDDNTDCKRLAHEATLTAPSVRSNWVEIPVEKLEDKY